MKYKIVAAKSIGVLPDLSKKYRLRGRGCLGAPRRIQGKPTETKNLFDFGSFYDPRLIPKPPSLFKKLVLSVKYAILRMAEKSSQASERLTYKVISKMKQQKARRRKLPSLFPTLCGALCAVLLVSLLSLGVVIYKLVGKNYIGRYNEVTVPDFIGYTYSESADIFNVEHCDVVVKYEYSSELPMGTVIAQTPSAGVVRKILSGSEPYKIELTVCLGKETFTMEDYTSLSLRDALLDLKNKSVKVRIQKDYSKSVPEGKIISTSPSAKESFFAENTVLLRVSLGAKKIYASVPNVCGMTEARAEAVLRAAGFNVGQIDYVNSALPTGTVISQNPDSYSTSEAGSSVSLKISAGVKYNEKKMPDLYGLTIEEAKSRLAEVGLVCGSIYAVANGASHGTVIAQSLIAGAPITPGTVSVDIYVS